MKASDTIQTMICNECNMAGTGMCPKCDIKKALDLLEKAEQNRIIEIPVPLGDFVYCINPEFEVVGTTLNMENALFILKWWGIRFFATREETEKRLEELKNED